MSRHKLLLINPSLKGVYKDEFDLIPPISLGVIAALTPKNWTIEIADELVDTINYTHDYSLVAILTKPLNIMHTYDISRQFREKSVKVVLGGWHASAVPDEAVKYCDAVVIGNAENIWTQVISDFENKNLQQKYFSKNNTFDFVTPDNSYFRDVYFTDGIETSRGCCNNCSYCGIHVINHQAHKRKSVDQVVGEMKACKNKHFFIVDNNFYGNDEAYLESLFNEMIREKIKKKWSTPISVNFFKNEKLVSLAAKSGASFFMVGFDSDTTDSLTYLKKENKDDANDTFEAYQRIVKLCHKNNILVSGMAMIGLENDTEEKINNRIEFFKNLHLDFCVCVIMTPLPNTRLYNKLLAEGRLKYTNYPADWKLYTYSNNVYNNDNITPERLNELVRSGDKSLSITFKGILKSFLISGSLNASAFFYYQCKQLANYNNKYLNYFFYLLTGKKQFIKKT